MRQLFDILQTAEPVLEKLLTNSIGMKLVLVPPGTFLMEAPESETGRRLNETPQHEVTISQAFYVGVHTVTQQQYQYVVSRNPSRFQQAGGQATLEHPIENVSWEDALAFCRLLSALPAELEAGRTYRLPTEAEWEYTCRAGSHLPFGFGASLTSLQANFDGHYPWAGPRGSFLQQTTKIGSYPCNNFGLCETHGNVWEWCNDWYDEGYYRVSPQHNRRDRRKERSACCTAAAGGAMPQPAGRPIETVWHRPSVIAIQGSVWSPSPYPKGRSQRSRDIDRVLTVDRAVVAQSTMIAHSS